MLTVGAVDAAGVVPAWSSRGPDFAGRPKPDLVAPGVGLVGLRAPGSTIDLANPSARVGDHYFRGSGTSMSTAVVAGAAARVAAAHPEWGPDRIKAALIGTADPLGAVPGQRARAPGRSTWRRRKLVPLEDLLAAATPSAHGPRPRSGSASPRAWSAGCAATTRCCTRTGSGPPTW